MRLLTWPTTPYPRIRAFLLVLVGASLLPPSSPAAEKNSTPKPTQAVAATAHADADADADADAGADAGADADAESGAEENEGPQRLIERMSWFRQGRLGTDGQIPYDARNRAFVQLEANIRGGTLGGEPQHVIPGDGWSPVGPAPLLDRGSLFSGRVTAIAIHPTNANIAYVGAAQGGVWKTIDHGATWTPLTDTQRSLAVGSIAIDPSNPNTIYVGTGEANSSCDSYFGAGILKSIDGGASWSLIAASPFANTSVGRIIVHPTNSNVLWATNTDGLGGFICYFPNVAVSVGVWKSTNGGTTWTPVLSQGRTHDLAIDPTNANILYAGVDNSGIWKTLDGGATWTHPTVGLPSAASIGRVAIGIHPTTPSILYALFSSSSNGAQLGGTYKSTNGGTTWTLLTNSKQTGGCQYWTFQDVCTYSGSGGGQCWYDLVIGVDSAGGVWAGGTGIWRSSNGGTSWTALCPQTVHTDQHALAFRGSDVWLGNDGGVWTTANAGANWTNRNLGLAITQFYPGAALHPSNAASAMGGAQDNGALSYSGAPTWNLMLTGDGASTAYDLSDPDSIRYASWQFLNIVKSFDGGGNWQSAVSGLSDANTNNTAFISPFVICPNNPQVLIAGSNNVWRTDNGAASWVANGPERTNISSLAFARSTGDCQTYFTADTGGSVFRTTDGGVSWADITPGLPGYALNDIAVDPTNSAVVMVGVSGFGFGLRHVWRTTNALDPNPTWVFIDAGIPNVPVNAVLIDPTASNVLYIGTDIGVFRSTDAGSSWQVFMGGHPTVAVFDLVANAATGTIMSFTHGRGVFKLGTFCSDGDVCTTDTYDQLLGCQHGVVTCTALDQCHVAGTCDSQTGCSNPAKLDGTGCNDENACTANDACVGGVCLADPPPSCDDTDPCTSNTCNPLTGACENPPIVCNDQNSCTDDGCNLTTGCVYTANDGNVCTDNSLCTTVDVCQSGACVGQLPVVCAPDANVCTMEACDPATGACVTTNNTGPCDDQNVCTIGESCGPVLNENFDTVTTPSLPATWTTAVTGSGGPWTTVSTSSDTAPNSAFAINSAAVSDKRLVTPPIAITSAAATLTFKNRWSFQDPTLALDGGVLEISIGGGPFTDIETAGGSFVSGGYNDVIYPFSGNPLANRPAWSRISPGYPNYLTTIVNLPAAAAGQTIRLQWRVGTDTCCSAVGQNIDSVVVFDGTNTCNPAAFVSCDDSNSCTDDGCNPTTGCYVTTDETNDCDDGIPCTAGDACDAAATCAGVPGPPPGEVDDNVQLSRSGTTASIQWSMAPNSTSSDILRGVVSALPVGPGGLDEVCFDNVPGTSTTDPDVPAAGTGYWYLIRGASACGIGGYGFEGVNGVPTVPRLSTTCP